MFVPYWMIETKKLNDALAFMEWNEYFVNPGVMLEAFNRIQDFHDTGRITCRCGGSGGKDIVVGLNADSINLTCRSCMAGIVIRASNALDLKRLQSMDSVYIGVSLQKRINY